jgi:hypothetical protein
MGRKGPGYISPTVQKEAIARSAQYRGVEIAAWHVDEDESGGTQVGDVFLRLSSWTLSSKGAHLQAFL